jgi:DNA-binding MarR family transcriptional regulator
MRRDVDLLRDLMLALEPIERSPPEPIFLELDDIAQKTGQTPESIVAHLDLLLEQGFIEGPGIYRRAWLFRKLTAKGQALADNIRDARNWDAVKQTYSSMLEQ